jgi:phytoene dehydrogenase-like protein
MQHFDAIVVGAGIAGLGTAGLLQKQGLKTLVLEKSRTPGGRAKTRTLPGGWRVDSGTHCVDNGDRSACAELLGRIGAGISWSRPVLGLNVFDGHRWKDMAEYFNLSAAELQQLTDLENSFIPMTENEIDMLDLVSLADFIKERVRSTAVAEYLKTIGMVQTTLTDDEKISAGEFVSIYREGMQCGGGFGKLANVQMPLGGIGAMIGAMAEACNKRGCEIRFSTPLKKVRISGSDGAQVLLDSGPLQAPVVVLAMPIWQLSGLVEVDDTPSLRQWHETMHNLRDETSASMGFTIGTRRPLFTEPVYLSAWRLPGVGLPLQILGHTNFDDTVAPPGHMIAFIGAPCTPAQARDEDFRKLTLERFWQTVKVMFPSVEDDLVWKVDGHYVGIDGLGRSPGLTGKHRPPVAMPGMKGLYFAGDCYTGRGVGMNAAANSAMLCADRIKADLAP